MPDPRCAMLVIGDGRDDLKADTLASFHEHALNIGIVLVVEVDDREHELGFCGAIREGWSRLRALADERAFDYVAHIEEDFHFDRSFDVAAMARLLDAQPHLAQVALRRGPVNDYERGFGEDISMIWPDAFEQKWYGEIPPGGEATSYLEGRLNFTTNPSLYRRSLIEEFDWPEAPACEEAFSRTLLAEGYSFAYLGGRGPGWVTHTGDVRTGCGY